MIGIYCIKNLINEKRYIGQSGNILKRWNSHISDLKNGSHRNRLLQSDFDKVGVEGFSFTVLEELEDRVNINEREQYWINKLKTFEEYNQQVSLSEENIDNIEYIPIEILNGINVSLRRHPKDGCISYITYEILIGILNEYYKSKDNKIDISISKILKMRNLKRGKATHKTCELYFNKLVDITLCNEPIIECVEYNPKYNKGNFVLLNNLFTKELKFMPYNKKIFNSLSTAMTKHLYLLINLHKLKTSNKVISINKDEIFIYDDSDIYSYNRKVKNAFEELVDRKLIKTFSTKEHSFEVHL